ncbi:MAG: ABC transporter ATP-binding protein [Planctomycetota bacterium]|jgi:putative ABC transport system ATP-binding protein
MISLKKLRFSYGRSDFQLLIEELTLEEGPSVAVIGPSGSGKTTLLNLVAGVMVPQAGNITVNGTEITKLEDTARRNFRIANMGLVFQEFELLRYLNVLDNILLPYRISPELKLNRVVRDRAIELAESVGIADKLKRYTGQMSQGERQRVAVCRALLTKPHLLLADEPTGNLDPKNKGRVLDILFDYIKQTGATILSVTHDLSLVERFDRVIDFQDFTPESSGSKERGGKS